MKIRNGFVSNSSSSSFIVAVKTTGEVCKCCGRKDFNFFDRIQQAEFQNDENSVKALNQPEKIVEEYFDGYTWYDDTNPQELIKKNQEKADLLAQLLYYSSEEPEWDVALIQICYHDEVLNDEFEVLKKAGKLVIIKDLN